MDTGLYCSSGQKGPIPFGPGMFLGWERVRATGLLSTGLTQAGPAGQPAHLTYCRWGAWELSNGGVERKRVEELLPDGESFSSFCQLIGLLFSLRVGAMFQEDAQIIWTFERAEKATLWDSSGQPIYFAPPLILGWQRTEDLSLRLSLLRQSARILIEGQEDILCPYVRDKSRFGKLAELVALLANLQLRTIEKGSDRMGIEFFALDTEDANRKQLGLFPAT